MKDVRQIVGPGALIGVSTHGIGQARRAVLEGASYLGAGPTFPSGTKAFTHFPGLNYLREVASEITLPVFAIGGIDHSNVAKVTEAGINRIAVTAAVTEADDPAEAARELRAALVQ